MHTLDYAAACDCRHVTTLPGVTFADRGACFVLEPGGG